MKIHSSYWVSRYWGSPCFLFSCRMHESHQQTTWWQGAEWT